jgi:hypothetical protein
MSDTERDILDDIAIGANLSEEFATNCSTFASWGFVHARAKAEARRTEETKDVIWAKLQLKYRKEHKAPKENEVKAWCTKHPAYRKAVLKWNEAKYHRDVIHAAVEAFRQRKDMLVQLGADKRAELDTTDLSLKKKIGRANKVLRETIGKKPKRKRRK